MERPLNVLMVEDSEDDAELLLLELRRRGFAPTATRVDTGPALQTALAERAWDVVISDHNMPCFSGDDALKLVKSSAPDVPFIVVSGTRGEEHAVDAMRAGASDFIVKTRLHRLAPVVERELHEAAQRAEQRRMSEALAESQHQLRQAQKLEALGRLAGGVAHDFNNLLAVILGYADIVLKGLPSDDSHRGDIQEIKRAATRAAELTRQLLAFSRQQVLEAVVLNLNGVIDGVLQLLRHLVDESIAIELHCQTDLWNIKGDRIRMEQVLMNLVSNARDAMPHGGTLTLTTANVLVGPSTPVDRPLLPGRYVRLEVRDTGIGIPEDVLPKIFEPFFTTKEVGRGTGLGLATVHGIVQQSQGSIFVESRPGHGTTFTTYLPETAEPVAAEASAAVTSLGPATYDRVLLVDTDPAVRELGSRVLTKAGYHVTVAASPDRVLAALTSDAAPVGLLVTALNMPDTTGLALAQRMRATHPNLPALFITDPKGPRIDLLEIFKHGDILVKPFTSTDLLTKVRDAVGSSES